MNTTSEYQQCSFIVGLKTDYTQSENINNIV